VDEHVDHRHDDLRLFLPGKCDDGVQTQQQRCSYDEGRQLRVDERRSQPARESVASSHRRAPVTAVPSISESGGLRVMVSCSWTPARISTWSPSAMPGETARSLARFSRSTENTNVS